MGNYNYLLLLLISYLGLFAGTIIAYFSKEELAKGKKYFLLLRPMIFSAVLVIFLYFLEASLVVFSLIGTISFILAFYFEKKLYFINTNLFYYLFFSIMLFESKSPLTAVLVFFFGMVSASLRTAKLAKLSLIRNLVDVLSNNIVYLISGVLLFFLL